MRHVGPQHRALKVIIFEVSVQRLDEEFAVRRSKENTAGVTQIANRFQLAASPASRAHVSLSKRIFVLLFVELPDYGAQLVEQYRLESFQRHVQQREEGEDPRDQRNFRAPGWVQQRSCYGAADTLLTGDHLVADVVYRNISISPTSR